MTGTAVQIRNRPNQEILAPDWLITSHVTLITSSDWLFTSFGLFLKELCFECLQYETFVTRTFSSETEVERDAWVEILNKTMTSLRAAETLKMESLDLRPSDDKAKKSSFLEKSLGVGGEGELKKSLEDFEMLKVLGKGTFGKVMLARDKSTSEVYAIKVLRKDVVIEKEEIAHTMTEGRVLRMSRHPFLTLSSSTGDSLIHIWGGMPLPSGGDGDRDDFVTINVGGLKFQTRRSTLKRFPKTLLGSPEIEEFYVPELQEYFFDRSRSAFEQIMYYYQSAGIMCLPASVNPDIFVEELKFFKMDERVVKRFNAVGHITQGGAEIPEDVFTFPIQKKIWLLLDEPNSSLPAKLIGYLDQIVIILAVIAQCAESLPNIRLAPDDSKDLIGSISFKVRLARRVFSQNLVDERGVPSGPLERYRKFPILSRSLVMTIGNLRYRTNGPGDTPRSSTKFCEKTRRATLTLILDLAEPRLHYSFQTEDRLCFVMDYVRGGEDDQHFTVEIMH
eukprot:sb/3464022/